MKNSFRRILRLAIPFCLISILALFLGFSIAQADLGSLGKGRGHGYGRGHGSHKPPKQFNFIEDDPEIKRLLECAETKDDDGHHGDKDRHKDGLDRKKDDGKGRDDRDDRFGHGGKKECTLRLKVPPKPVPPAAALKLSGGLAALYSAPEILGKKTHSALLGINTFDGRECVKAFIRTTGGDPGLAASGVLDLKRQTDSLYIGNIPIANLVQVAGLSGVVRIEPAFKCRPHLDASVPSMKADLVKTSAKLGYRGAGVVVGVVDSGIDLTHRDFYDASNNLRVKWLQDQTQTGMPTFTGQGPILSSGQTDTDGHGTHVASTAVGTGNLGHAPGVASESDIFFVKTTFDTTDIVQGVSDIFSAPERAGKPAVVNLSLGSYYPSHDGTTEFETRLRDMCTGNQAVVVSAGNDGGDAFHTGSQVLGIAPRNVMFNVPPAVSAVRGAFQIITCWYDGPDEFNITVTSPDGGTFSLAYGTTWDYAYILNAAGTFYSYVEVDTATGAGGIRGYYIILGTESSYWPQAGNWTVSLTPTATSSGSGHFDMWTGTTNVIGDPDYIATFTTNDTFGTLGVPATAEKVITVGSHITKMLWNSTCGTFGYGTYGSMNGLSPFSGKGPTRAISGVSPARIKPDITAPGMGIVAAYSAQWASSTDPADCSVVLANAPNGLVLEQGTSMAAPHITGMVALMMSANPTLTFDQIKTVMGNTARRDSFTGGDASFPSQDNSWGFGKADALHAALAVAPGKWSKIPDPPGMTFTNNPLRTTARDVEISPNYATDHTIFVLYDSGGPLEPMTDVHGEIWKYNTQTTVWTRLGASYFLTDGITDIELSPTYNDTGAVGTNARTLFVGSYTPVGVPMAGRLSRSVDGGASFSTIMNGVESDWLFGGYGAPNRIECAPLPTGAPSTAPITLFAGFVGHVRLHRSVDTGTTWTPLGTHDNDDYIRPLMVSPNYASDRMLFTSRSGSIYFRRSLDGGDNFSSADSDLPTGGPRQPLPNIYSMDSAWTSPTDFRIYLGGGNQGGHMANTYTRYKNITAWGEGLLWGSGATPPWNLIRLMESDAVTPIEEFTSAVALSPAFGKDRVVFAGTYIDFLATTGDIFYSKGVFKSFDGGTNWMPFSGGFGTTPPTFTKLAVSGNYPNDGVIFAGTTDGLWVDPVEDLPGTVDDVPSVGSKAHPGEDYIRFQRVEPSVKVWNPRSGPLTLKYGLENGRSTQNQVWVRITDMSGRVVVEKDKVPQRPGDHSVRWDGMDSSGNPVTPGSYQLRVLATKPPYHRYSTAVTIQVTDDFTAASGPTPVESPAAIVYQAPTPTPTRIPLDEWKQWAGNGDSGIEGNKSMERWKGKLKKR